VAGDVVFGRHFGRLYGVTKETTPSVAGPVPVKHFSILIIFGRRIFWRMLA